ncbi:TolB family protein [Sphingomonas oleivorans]|nr:hypothetical protein [Sphingomonas oleivorans]
MAPDGSHLIFVSNRPIVKGGALLDGHFNNRDFPAQGGALWRVDRTIGGWSEPQRLPDSINTPQGASFAPAIAADGSLYFMRSDPQSGRFRLYRSSWSASGYGAPEPLSFSTGASTDVDPAVAPDQSFLVFGSGPARAAVARGMDLFIVFRRADGGWGRPVHLGERVNAPGSDAEARLSPDHRTLFFSSERKTAHHPDAPWNNGLYNIWSMSLRSRMMAELKHRSLSEASGGH